ncbi:cytochrome b5 [Rhizophagus irregularis]|uniref:Cytochrome b5 n=2 Tax=Rhizophagus irregularis TaxID=588596 RepID=A0A2I1GRJ6_9GLOM|nr:cytochrome b5-like heme/steroid binding domain-containing protein [Rhizophagus irregularis DAOM 181602=DAOM 197198]PKC15721.1 cytochrome b5 [Rhizophagus irregularis]PKC72909.1 cytochrome b5 [Rhizophagus irregularis]PKK72994.1 cytochrome b5 [Rhizophagus irregularis]PKY14876.1 cytochrome b5 [Rhizophagus irregularis]PKY49282.1 cytochrome b5 [Rhizophagus irregularis]|eukprot:XP_025190115.1 cytochrome b5-like heme/steroid binding domain-containing protein [Rhizophagus irregularis DAOM 181602=DAOM 197198]
MPPVQRKKDTSNLSENYVPSKTSKEYDQKKSSSSGGLICLSILQVILTFLIINFAASFFLTETWFWGYEGKYTNWRNWIPRREIIFSEAELAKYDGSDPNLPIYIAMNGEVFDVTAGKHYYGKGGGYNFFAGKDASRAYITGCFETHLTHDLRGLTHQQIKDLENWAGFYRDHHTYYKVGRVVHPPIDPKTPIPPPCNDASAQKSQ